MVLKYFCILIFEVFLNSPIYHPLLARTESLGTPVYSDDDGSSRECSFYVISPPRWGFVRYSTPCLEGWLRLILLCC